MSERNRVYIYYDAETDYLEVVSQKGEIVAHDAGNGIFKLKTRRGKLLGYAVMEVSERLGELTFIDPLVKFSIQVKVARLKRGLTQEKMAKRMGIGLLPYQRIESGGNNPTLKTILKVKEVLPEISLDKIAS
ncbi:MAG: helix-turn-helix transcriptional regulator [Oligoflexales bacterium]